MINAKILFGKLAQQAEHDFRRLRQLSKELEVEKKKVQKHNERLLQQLRKFAELQASVSDQINDYKEFRASIHASIKRAENRQKYGMPLGTNLTPRVGIIKNVQAIVHRAHPRPLLPTDVRDVLVDSGFGDSPNLLPEVHAALRRLATRGEVVVVPVGRRKAYRSKGTRGILMQMHLQ